MTLAAKITAGFLALVALLGALAAYQLALIHRLHATNRDLAETSFEAARLSLEMERRLGLMDEFSQKLFLLQDRGYAGELRRLRQDMERDLAVLQGKDLSPAERRQLEGFAERWQTYGAGAPGLEEQALVGRAPPTARAALARTFDQLRGEMHGLLDRSRQAMGERVAENAARAEGARVIAWGTTGLGLAAALVLSLAIVRSVVGPLARLARGTRELAGGDFSYQVEVSGGPEFAALARDFNAMAERLGELDRLKKDFLATVSHELKAPLASMQETTRLLLEGIPGPISEQQERLLRLNLGCGDRLSHMIADLLDLARLEAGAVEFEREPLDLAATARSALDELASLIRQNRLLVETRWPPGPVTVEGDRSLLLQVLSNLISNAAKFSPPGSAIGVEVRRLASHGELRRAYRRGPGRLRRPAAACEVWDSGPGVPDPHKEKIFTRFHRVEATRKGSQGTGLGLAIVRGIVDGHGGEVWVEDRPEGGSRFILLLESLSGTDS